MGFSHGEMRFWLDSNELFSKIGTDLNIDYSQISRIRSNSMSYGRITDDNYYFDLVDLYDLLDNMPSKYSKEVSNLNQFYRFSRLEDVYKCLYHYSKTFDLVPCLQLLKLIKIDIKTLETTYRKNYNK